MDGGNRGHDGNSIPPIMMVPEETMIEIFSYLSFETLHFSLRKVCKKIQAMVDRYLKVRGTSFLVGRQECWGKEVIEIIKKPKKGFIILRAPVSSVPCGTSTLQYNESLDEYGDSRINKVLFAAMRETGVCYIYKNEKGLIYRYDLDSDKWENILENSSTLKCLDHDEPSHECIQRLVSDDFPHYFENHSYGHYNYPFVLVKDKDKPWSACKITYSKRLKLN